MSSVGKEMFLRHHERLVDEYMDAHPNADEAKVYDAMADKAMEAVQDEVADQIDHARMLKKEGKL